MKIKLLICIILGTLSYNILGSPDVNLFEQKNSINLLQQQSNYIRVTGPTDNINYIKTLNVLSMAKRNSTINIELINNPGGAVQKGYAIIKILNKYKKFKGLKYHFIIKGYCHSMCTMLLSTANKVTIDDDTPMVFHTFQMCVLKYCGSVTRGSKIYLLHKYYGEYLRKVLTKQQYVEFKKGEDVWVYGKQFKKRYR